MTKDYADFLASLNSAGVDYVVIGGMAVLSYVPYRTTRDIDVLIRPTIENARKARGAVKDWGGFEPSFSAEEFLSGDIFSFGGLLRVEILSRVPGVSWERVWKNRVRGELLGVETWFASVEDLIEMKETTADPEKDLPELERLRRFLEGREDQR